MSVFPEEEEGSKAGRCFVCFRTHTTKCFTSCPDFLDAFSPPRVLQRETNRAEQQPDGTFLHVPACLSVPPPLFLLHYLTPSPLFSMWLCSLDVALGIQGLRLQSSVTTCRSQRSLRCNAMPYCLSEMSEWSLWSLRASAEKVFVEHCVLDTSCAPVISTNNIKHL